MGTKSYISAFCCLILMQTALTSFSGEVRTHVFNIVHKGQESGTLEVVETPTPSQTSYQYVMDLHTKFLFKSIHVEYNMDAVYKKGQLMSYHLVYKLNDKLMDEVDLKWSDNKYTITTPKEVKEHLKKIRYSTILLFCKKPVDRPQVWGELICENNKISKIKEDHYKVTFSNRKFNEYYYEGKKLMRASVQTALLDFDMVRAD